MSLVNTCRDAFYVLAGMGGVGQHMLSYILAWEVFGHHVLRCIFLFAGMR